MDKNLAEKIWHVVMPVLQIIKLHRGRPQHNPKKAFLGILYVLENGIKWSCLPRYYGAKSTVHGKYMKWVLAGLIQKAFEAIRALYLANSSAFNNWYATDTSSCKAPYANFSGKNPTDRAKRGVKKNILCDSRGAPLVLTVAPANRHDSKTLLELLDLAKAIKPNMLVIVAADSAYDSSKLKKAAADRGFVLHAATNKRRRNDSTIIRPKGRWIVEGCHSWLNNFRAVKTCFAKTSQSFLGFVLLAATVRLFQMI